MDMQPRARLDASTRSLEDMQLFFATFFCNFFLQLFFATFARGAVKREEEKFFRTGADRVDRTFHKPYSPVGADWADCAVSGPPPTHQRV
jgi:hypothetical protein